MITLETIQTINFYLASAGVVTLCISLVLAYDSIAKQHVVKYIQKFGLWIALLTSLGASTMTLVYSEVFGFVPCGLCWLERVFLYPQIILAIIALWRKDLEVAYYGIGLSCIGFLISIYHHTIQMGVTSIQKCPTAGAGADCAKRIMFEFDFVTFPLLAAILFIFLSVLYLYILKSRYL